MKVNLKDSILSQLIILIIVIILVPLLFLGYTAYGSYKKNIETKIISNNFEILHQVDLNISKVLNQIHSVINTYNNNHTIEEYLTKEFISSYDKIKTTETLEKRLKDNLASINWINFDIILIGENNGIYTTSNNHPRLSGGSISQSYWYEKTLEKKEFINWFIFEKSYFSNNSNDSRIVATKSLINNTTQKKYGVIIIEISEEYFYNIYKDATSPDEVLMIRDKAGNIITSSDRSITPSLNPQKNSIPIEKDKVLYNYPYSDNKYIGLNEKSTISDWTITKLISVGKMNKEIDTLQYHFLIIYVICIILVFIGIFITAVRIYKPIETLRIKLKSQFKSQKNPQEINTLSLYEVMTGYEQLIQEVDDTVDHLIEENEIRRKTELHALEMQINPHFLYNTLNSIKCLVWTKEYHLIEPTITALVKILQQTLRRKEELIPLKAEVESVKNYIYIQNIRTDNSMQVNYDIEKSLYDIKVPFLILQPLVENAIFHGVEPLGKPGIITISAYREDNNLHIEVLDNGVGISQEKIEELVKQTKNPNKTGFNNIGLANIKERIQLYYGKEYGINIKSKMGIGTSVTIKIKIETDDLL